MDVFPQHINDLIGIAKKELCIHKRGELLRLRFGNLR